MLSSSDPDSSRVREMFNDLYDSYDFPGEKEYFGDLVVYVRRSEPKSPGS